MTLTQAHSQAKKTSRKAMKEGYNSEYFVLWDDSYGYGDDFYHVANNRELDTFYAGIEPIAVYSCGQLEA